MTASDPASEPASDPAAAPVPTAPPRRRRGFWAAVLAATALTAAGVAVAVHGWVATDGPAGAVRGYFDALSRADAAAALAYGDIPAGPRTFLTGDALRAAQRTAAIEDVDVRSSEQTGDRARVRVAYTLAFARHPLPVTATVGVHRTGDGWRLDHVAVATQVQLVQAGERATLAGVAVPAGTTLLFPGAVPVAFDTPYLRADPANDDVPVDAGATTQVLVDVTAAGRTAAVAALRAALARCLRAGADLRCPLPTERYVPGSLRGTVSSGLSGTDVDVAASDAGMLEIKTTVAVRGGFSRLEFDNTVTKRSGTTFRMAVAAHAYAVPPLRLQWDRPT
ncbi:hypothetical protein SAMN05443575_1407 [Jatrophihabitans endophyticus]|uniref:Uncharacterized protein n=1 Tax=Jatrophihabitans endophyticus TaxID=1206085 RepID=A0A1M5H5S5_9ACTN|nr:hypothetical protein [Jatrophihabitans endophyticus]SHG11360.1 hypothetical protein SAMN05443575_1407 [Jatrophihabitans endophyticus]